MDWTYSVLSHSNRRQCLGTWPFLRALLKTLCIGCLAKLFRTHESHIGVELVIRTTPVVANYDYLVDYVFTGKGILKVEVSTTVMDAVKAVKTRQMDDASFIMETKAAYLVTANLLRKTQKKHIQRTFRYWVDPDQRGLLTIFPGLN